MERVALGLDVGTSALKVSVYSVEKQGVVKNINVKYLENEVAPGISRLSKYTETIIDTINNIGDIYEVCSIALSTQMYSFVVEEDGQKLVYQWNVPWKTDKKAAEVVAQYTNISGCPVDALFPAYKIISSRLDEKSNLDIKPYGLQESIVYELTGVLAGDYCNLSSYGFMNVLERKWNKELLEKAGFNLNEMPKIVRYNEPVGPINNPKIKLNNKIIISCGLGDGPSASYASKDVSNIAVNIGTSMAVRGFVEDVKEIDFKSVWTFVVDENTWVSGGISSNGSSVLDHYRNIGFMKDWELTPSIADNNVFYFPWNHGERTPYWSSKLRETMVGAGMHTTKNDYMCAIFRGISFTIATMYNEVNKHIDKTDMICIAGGGANSEILMGYLSGTLPVKLGILQDFDFLGSYGAAYIAAEAMGERPIRNQNLIKIYVPTQQHVEVYKKWLDYSKMYSSLYEKMEG
ncbi:MAG: FGGY family carbohydrate kinase [Mobilitalea sp.]